MLTDETIENEIGELECAFEDMEENEPNDDSYARVVNSLSRLQQYADALLMCDR